MEFKPFRKIPRLTSTIYVTEKIDGTNVVVAISADGNIFAGSRSRWVTPDNDNYGFAQWVADNKYELLKLGEGYHYGEWWGRKIQRGYGLDERRFSLFDTAIQPDSPAFPKCCHVVPLLGVTNNLDFIQECYEVLRVSGSKAVPGYMNPEGIVLYHSASGIYLKWTYNGNGHKWEGNL